jgi:hypothetical protein
MSPSYLYHGKLSAGLTRVRVPNPLFLLQPLLLLLRHRAKLQSHPLRKWMYTQPIVPPQGACASRPD